MKTAMFYDQHREFTSGKQLGKLACAVALLPLLLWPSLVRGACCCVSLADHSQVEWTCETPSEPAATSTSGAHPPPLELATSYTCSHCIASEQLDVAIATADAGTLKFPCDCGAYALADFISPRADITLTELRTQSLTSDFPAPPAAASRQLAATASAVSVRLLAPTPQGRRALLCCWLI